MTKAEDLKCGDIFKFRDKIYLCLLSFTDCRHTQTIVTATPYLPKGDGVVCFRLMRTFKVEVIGKKETTLTVIENTIAELGTCEPPNKSVRW